ncbi:VanZ family protein [Spirosoma taeanense]|uniref:VanZ family protein n=1 Tax=Spirosoma taeanense TaxID=2735870 RepID=A0A6M5Y4Q4_9BACT|nr:VanZ family protein [Spirosoma taeanense]QJW88404.1 VanZ family protein [Spirosoma taeanense]
MNNPTLRRAAAIAWTLIMLWGCLLPGPKVPRIMAWHDKLMHVVIFVLFSVLWMLARPGGRTNWPDRAGAIRVLLAGLAFGIIIEVLQYTLPIRRSGDVEDVIADFAGALLGVGVIWLGQTMLKRSDVSR